MVGKTINAYRIETVLGESRSDDLLVARTVGAGGDEIPVLLQVVHVALRVEGLARDLHRTQRSIRQLNRDDILAIEGVEKVDAGEAVADDSAEQAGDFLLLRLPYVEGPTLRAHLAGLRESGQAFDEAEALAVIGALAQGLAAALRSGLVHRTLLPQHILMRPEGGPAMLGLDMPVTLCNALIAASDEEQRIYQSPEQRQGMALDGRSNIYSLGVMLFEMLATGDGVAPTWRIDQEKELSGESLRGLRPDLRPATYRLLDRALQPQSWARYQTYDELLGALGMETGPAAVAQGVAPRPTPRRAPQRVRMPQVQPGAPGRRLAIVALLAVLLLIAAGALFGGSGLPAGIDPEAREMVESEPEGSLSAPLQPPQRALPSPTLAEPSATPRTDNIASGVTSTPSATPPTPASPTAEPVVASSPTAQPTATTPPTETPLPPPPPPPATATPEPSPTSAPTATAQPTDPPPPPPPPPPATATATPEPTDPPPPTPTPPPPVPPSPTTEAAPLPSPTATSPLANIVP